MSTLSVIYVPVLYSEPQWSTAKATEAEAQTFIDDRVASGYDQDAYIITAKKVS